ncbi:MAG: hypothetical protein EA349_14590 [Halomonadaceae bacterium]|nr:MAG: hypothetical protein EA349_14590 [Halomonadaceae bacterium]
MPVKQTTVASEQGYSIDRIVETDPQGNPVMETYALYHEGGTLIDEFADLADVVKALNRILEPLPGIALDRLRRAS